MKELQKVGCYQHVKKELLRSQSSNLLPETKTIKKYNSCFRSIFFPLAKTWSLVRKMRLFLVVLLISVAFAAGCANFDKYLNLFCKYGSEPKPCTIEKCKLHNFYQPELSIADTAFKSACCSLPGSCSFSEFPKDNVCCFSQECLSRCFPDKKYQLGSVYWELIELCSFEEHLLIRFQTNKVYFVTSWKNENAVLNQNVWHINISFLKLYSQDKSGLLSSSLGFSLPYLGPRFFSCLINFLIFSL